VGILLNPNAPYFIILLCLMPDNLTGQGETSGAQWVSTFFHPANRPIDFAKSFLFGFFY
jgi:hypothetical protein